MMTKEETKEKSKALPFQGTWTAAPNDVIRNYWVHPKFSPLCFAIYMHLLDRFNADEGYAYPTQDQIADTLLVSRQIVNARLKELEEIELIKIMKSPYGSNLVYIPLKPLKSIEEIEARFPEVIEYRLKHKERREKDRASRDQRKAEFEAEIKRLRTDVKKE